MGALNAWVEQQLASSHGPYAWLLLAVGGVAASALPCVYPLYPITVGILRSRQSSLGKAAHPLAYYAGLVAIYAALGAFAAATGGAFNQLLRLPGINLALGAGLVVMALASAGVLHVGLFRPWSEACGDSTSLQATAAMGAVAGLLSSACVGPVVVSVLVGLAAGAGADGASVAAAFVGAGKMAIFGLGVGAPIIALGVFGLSLPRSGRWTRWVQVGFGVLIGFFALGYLDKGLLGAGLSEASARAVLLSAAVLGWAVFSLQPVADDSSSLRVKRALFAVAAVAAVLFMARAVLPESARGVASASTAPSSAADDSLTSTSGNLTWHLDRDRAFEEAARTGRPVFIDFYGSWCTNCKAFEELSQDNASLNLALRGAVLLKVFDTSPLFEVFRKDSRFPELRVGLPFFVIMNSAGELLYKTADFTRTDEMIAFLVD